MRCTAGKQDGTVTGRYAGFCDHPLPSMLMLAPAVVVVQLHCVQAPPNMCLC